jgi:hypothetical protein
VADATLQLRVVLLELRVLCSQLRYGDVVHVFFNSSSSSRMCAAMDSLFTSRSSMIC